MTVSRLLPAFCLLVLATVTSPPPAASDQQQNSAAYVHWAIPGHPTDVIEVDQEIWITIPQKETQWVFIWTFEGLEHGGYLGFNTDHEGHSQALFSIWNATSATTGEDSANHCIKFDGEGQGYSCRRAIHLKRNRFYRLQLRRTLVDDKGVWWAAYITEEDWVEKAIEGDPSKKKKVPEANTFFLGSLRASLQSTHIHSNFGNFIEFFGDTVPHCSKVPQSGGYYSAPQAKKDENKDTFDYQAQYKNVTALSGCPTGNEAEGAIFVGGQYSFTTMPTAWKTLYPKATPSLDGAFLFLGGSKQKQTLGDKLRLDGIVPPPTTVLLYP